jgi:uncharacterized protein YbjT (DUF2867 family)
MDVVVAGGHGQIGLRLLRLLADRGDRARGIVRNPAHAPDLEQAGAQAIVLDMEAEDDFSGAVEGADAVVFAAGAGPGSGAERKATVDLGAAVKLMDAGVKRYVMVSAINADHPENAPEEMRPYYDAKAEADRRLQDAGLDFTIVRPGRLTNDEGTGLVDAGPEVQRAEIPRDDVAAVLAEVLLAPNTVGKAFNLVAGDTPVDAAVRSL